MDDEEEKVKNKTIDQTTTTTTTTTVRKEEGATANTTNNMIVDNRTGMTNGAINSSKAMKETIGHRPKLGSIEKVPVALLKKETIENQQQQLQLHPLLRDAKPPLRKSVIENNEVDEVLLQGYDGHSSIRLQIPKTLPVEDYYRNPKPPTSPSKHRRSTSGNRNNYGTLGPSATVQQQHHRRKASFTSEEQFVLDCFLIDEPPKPPAERFGTSPLQVPNRMTTDILFSAPDELHELNTNNNKKKKDDLKKPPPPRRRSITTLWEAHAAGVAPKALAKHGSRHLLSKNNSDNYLRGRARSSSASDSSFRRFNKSGSDDFNYRRMSSKGSSKKGGHRRTPSGGSGNKKPPGHRRISSAGCFRGYDGKAPSIGSAAAAAAAAAKGGGGNQHRRDSSQGSTFSFVSSLFDDGGSSYYDAASDEEVRHDEEDERSECSSWADDDVEHDFDPWQVLKHEYAREFGFDYNNPMLGDHDDDTAHNTFLILGTSADDKSAQPHVLSPPLMDALMNYMPERLKSTNFWLKFSLIRDGACLDTMKRYVRAPKCTIIAIETDRGEVFGSFTSHPWRTCPSFFGGAPAFVWRMKHSRRSKCFSLFDQAQLESEIDVFPFTGERQYVQACKHDLLAVGGDSDGPFELDLIGDASDTSSEVASSGFAIALEDDLLRGTTSPSFSFGNPSLCGAGDRTEVFYVSGLEVWTFTPARDVDMAEKMEMSKYFVEQSSRNSSMRSPNSSSRTSSSLRSVDLTQSDFYRRVGHDPESEERRDRWQRSNMMEGFKGGNRGIGASPRFAT